MFVFYFLLVLFFYYLLHVTFYIYICYWNTLQYKYIIQITFYVVKQSHRWVTSNLTRKLRLRESQQLNWRSALRFTSLNVPHCLLPKTTVKLLLYNLHHLIMIFEICLFIEAPWRPLFTKYALCKPLFPFQNNA